MKKRTYDELNVNEKSTLGFQTMNLMSDYYIFKFYNLKVVNLIVNYKQLK